MRGTIFDSALLQSAHVLRSSAATVGWQASPGTVLHQIHTLSEQARAIAEREILRSHKLDMRAWLVLRALDELKCATQRQIVAATDLDKVAVNRAASWLKERNFVLSLPNTEDGRSHFLELSHEGEKVLARCGEAIAQLERDMLAGLTEGERWQFLQSLQQLHRSLVHRV